MTKTVLVTGASRGIGASILESFASQGYFAVGTATSEAGSKAISEKMGDRGAGYVLDISSQDSVTALLSSFKEDGIDIDILVNNAGITRDTLVLRMKEQDWTDVIDTNLTGVFRVSKAFIRPMMKKQWGRIINISSVVGGMGQAGQANYSAAKAGVEGLTRAMAREFGSRNITVNAIAPGFIETEMTDGLSDDIKEKALEMIALNRFASPEEVAEVVKFLASDGAAYVTGECLQVNGGLFMK